MHTLARPIRISAGHALRWPRYCRRRESPLVPTPAMSGCGAACPRSFPALWSGRPRCARRPGYKNRQVRGRISTNLPRLPILPQTAPKPGRGVTLEPGNGRWPWAFCGNSGLTLTTKRPQQPRKRNGKRLTCNRFSPGARTRVPAPPKRVRRKRTPVSAKPVPKNWHDAPPRKHGKDCLLTTTNENQTLICRASSNKTDNLRIVQSFLNSSHAQCNTISRCGWSATRYGNGSGVLYRGTADRSFWIVNRWPGTSLPRSLRCRVSVRCRLPHSAFAAALDSYTIFVVQLSKFHTSLIQSS